MAWAWSKYADIGSLYQNGATVDELCQRYNVSYRAVVRTLTKQGYTIDKRPNRGNKRYDGCVEIFDKGYTIDAIVEMYNTERKNIIQALKQRGVAIKDEHFNKECECKSCGNPFMSNGLTKYCSDECRRQAKNKRMYNHLYGDPVKHEEKKKRDREYHKNPKRKEGIKTAVKKHYIKKKKQRLINGNERQRKECAKYGIDFKTLTDNEKAIVNLQTKSMRLYSIVCKECGKPYVKEYNAVTRKDRDLYCDTCIRGKRMMGKVFELREVTCNVCGEKIIGKHNKRTCPKCEAIKHKEYRRITKHRKRARSKSVKSESYSPTAVFERDKWICQLCGDKLNKKLRGTFDDKAPELDHIIPLSKGGDDMMYNVQCACRKCNSTKSNKMIGQLRIAI
jgi:5-methylcytosine-specific restriction endonuclease McrA